MEKFTFNVSEGKMTVNNDTGDSKSAASVAENRDEGRVHYEGIVERQRKASFRKKLIGGLALIAVLLLGFFLLIMLRHYDNYEVLGTTKIKDASASKYEMFNGSLLKYGNDGAILTDATGKVSWNVGYEMTAPEIDMCDGYLIVYDRGGSRIYLLDGVGEVSEISTTQPISKAEVSGAGTIAVIMKGELKSRIELYNKKGETLASGELHINNSGYPTDIALSSGGQLLMVSSIGYEKGEVVSKISFYNFGNAGRNRIDNIVSSYKYKGTVIPEVDITDKGRPVAIGTDKIICYSTGNKPAEKSVIEPGEQMKSVIHNDKYIGFVVAEEGKDGVLQNTLKLYTYHGMKRYSKKLDFEYRDIKLMDDNEVMLTDGHKVNFISVLGMNRFFINDDEEIYDVVNKKAGREFYFVRSDSVQHVKLCN
ncbi:MAG: DUF5711 family protein [Lachnospiraceae bacterium]|nr:DUF5711 family protein [Lachnospiraceae bacterium]